MDQDRVTPCCPAKPELRDRPLLTTTQASDLEATFKILANGTRLRILHSLTRSDELCVSEIAETLGLKATAVSNQLQRLQDRGIVQSRRDGNQIYYRIIDPCVVKLLDSAWCLTEDARMRGSEEMAREGSKR